MERATVKLSIMAFIGNFPETYQLLQPVSTSHSRDLVVGHHVTRAWCCEWDLFVCCCSNWMPSSALPTPSANLRKSDRCLRCVKIYQRFILPTSQECSMLLHPGIAVIFSRSFSPLEIIWTARNVVLCTASNCSRSTWFVKTSQLCLPLTMFLVLAL